MVAPGFIDVHTHDDHALLSKPDMSYKTSQVLRPSSRAIAGSASRRFALQATDHHPLDLLGDGYKFPRMSDFFDAIDANPATTNAALLCGHTTLRSARWTI